MWSARFPVFAVLLSVISLFGRNSVISAFMSPKFAERLHSAHSTSHLEMSKLSAYETVLEFNAQFKQGLKYVLVPQAPNTGSLPRNYYDGAIPELLEAPVANSPMDYTAVSDLMVPAANMASNSYPTLNVKLPNIDLSRIPVPQFPNAIESDLENVLQQVSQTKLVVSTEKIDAMGQNVNAVLQAAKTVLASSFELAAKSPVVEAAAVANTKLKDVAIVANKNIVDPVVDRTMTQIKYAITHPPDFSGYTFSGAPPEQGLATPLLDYVTRSLKAAQEQPPLFFADPLPDSFETVQYGFQVKNTAIETAHQIQSAIVASAQEIAANNEIAKEEIRKVMLHEMEQMQTRNALIAEKVAAQSQHNVEFLHDSQVAISNRILDNADSIATQLHMSEWTKSADQQIALLQQNFIGALRNNNLYQSDQINKDLSSLNMEELGGWYTGAFVGLILLLLAQKDKQAAIEAATTKLTAVTQKQIDQANIEKERLEDMVVELTQAVAILTEELRALKTQRLQTDNALASVQNDVKYVFSQKLTESFQQNELLRSQLESAKLEVQSLKEANQMLSGTSTVQLPPHPPLGPPPAVETERSSASVDNAFFANLATKSIIQATNAAKPKAATASAVTAPSKSGDDDWSKLPLSAIKRKPITEIMSYLQAKGASVIDKNGRPLSKSQLVDAIFSF